MLLMAGFSTMARAQTAPPPPAPPPSGGNGIGVGAAYFLSGIGGAQVDYDTAMWDIEALLGFADRSTGNGNNDNSQTDIQVGVRGWYHLHHGASSDFSVGGGVGFDHLTGGGGPNQTGVFIDPGVRARAFITSNVSVQAVLGLAISVGDNLGGQENKGVGLGAQSLFGFGFTYYFH
ncbi:MAG TPA: hypothetical protein VIU64_03655 [Polyangia bacterium]